jgi:hypothetical protein
MEWRWRGVRREGSWGIMNVRLRFGWCWMGTHESVEGLLTNDWDRGSTIRRRACRNGVLRRLRDFADRSGGGNECVDRPVDPASSSHQLDP